MKDIIGQLSERLRGHRVLLQTHDFPDPDAIASAAGLQYLLKQEGVPAEICFFGRLDKINHIRMIELFELSMTECSRLTQEEGTLVVTVDGQKNNSNFTDVPGDEIACIDHHPWVTDYSYEIVDHQLVGACATIVTGYFMERKLLPPRKLATALLYGIKMDTLNFCNGVTQKDIQAFSFLHDLVDHEAISYLNNSALELSDIKAYGSAIQNIVIYDRVGFAAIPFDCPDGLIASVSNFILSLDAVDVSVIYAARNGGYKFSVRSELAAINAGKLTNLALRDIGNGGGHPTMAGGLLYAERVHLLGEQVHEPIRKRFLDVYYEMRNAGKNR